MAMKSSSVCAPEPEKITKNKVKTDLWDTLYLLSLLSTIYSIYWTQILALDINNDLDLIYEEMFSFHNFSIIGK